MTAALTIGLVSIILGSLTVLYVRRDKTAQVIDADESARWFEKMRSLPETTAFDHREPLERRRLASVPAQQPRHLRAVRDDAMTDSEWERLMAVVHSIPEQRKAAD